MHIRIGDVNSIIMIDTEGVEVVIDKLHLLPDIEDYWRSKRLSKANYSKEIVLIYNEIAFVDKA